MAMPTNMGEWGNESESRVARRMEPAAFNAVCPSPRPPLSFFSGRGGKLGSHKM